MTTPEFTFSATDLDAGGKHVHRPIPAQWLRGVLEGTEIGASEADGELDLRLSRSGTDVVIRGTFAADLVVPCSRCLEPTVVPVREELSALAVPGPAGGKHDDEAAKDDEADAEEADVIAYDGETLVLDDLIRDELLLGIPMIPLCSEACPGIRPQRSEGAPDGKGIDPRLRPLLELKKKTT